MTEQPAGESPGPKVPTLKELLAQWKQNRLDDEAEAEWNTWD